MATEGLSFSFLMEDYPFVQAIWQQYQQSLQKLDKIILEFVEELALSLPY